VNDQEKAELKVATYVVGFFFFFGVWWIWNALDVSVFAMSAAAPQANATTFSLGAIGTSVLGPLAVTFGFVMSRAGKLILKFVAAMVARFAREAPSTTRLANATKVSAQFRKMDERVKTLENTVSKWEAVE